MLGTRIIKLEKFFGVRRPKDMSPGEWLEKLYDMEMDWEEEYQEPFPI